MSPPISQAAPAHRRWMLRGAAALAAAGLPLTLGVHPASWLLAANALLLVSAAAPGGTLWLAGGWCLVAELAVAGAGDAATVLLVGLGQGLAVLALAAASHPVASPRVLLAGWGDVIAGGGVAAAVVVVVMAGLPRFGPAAVAAGIVGIALVLTALAAATRQHRRPGGERGEQLTATEQQSRN